MANTQIPRAIWSWTACSTSQASLRATVLLRTLASLIRPVATTLQVLELREWVICRFPSDYCKCRHAVQARCLEPCHEYERASGRYHPGGRCASSPEIKRFRLQVSLRPALASSASSAPGPAAGTADAESCCPFCSSCGPRSSLQFVEIRNLRGVARWARWIRCSGHFLKVEQDEPAESYYDPQYDRVALPDEPDQSY
ncbi:hypothetical protein EDD21DRAFT_421982 [Dissophora ornata]|nr:hypothetical protein EDD21DRAFT_421982 [Dissophora ornata]